MEILSVDEVKDTVDVRYVEPYDDVETEVCLEFVHNIGQTLDKVRDLRYL